MTREEAKDYIRAWCPYDRQEEIIKALEQEPCEDCVSREFMYKLGAQCIAVRNENGELIAIAAIEGLPSVNPKAKTGHWINAKVGKLFPSNDFKCSECGNILDFDGVNCGRGDANYCPNCGAKMESEDEEWTEKKQ